MSTDNLTEVEAAEAAVEPLREQERLAIAHRITLVAGRDPETGLWRRRPGVSPAQLDEAVFAAEEATRAVRDAERRVNSLLRRITADAARRRQAPETARTAAGQAHEALKSLQSALTSLDNALGIMDAPSIATERAALSAAYTTIVGKLESDLAAVATGTYRAPAKRFVIGPDGGSDQSRAFDSGPQFDLSD